MTKRLDGLQSFTGQFLVQFREIVQLVLHHMGVHVDMYLERASKVVAQD